MKGYDEDLVLKEIGGDAIDTMYNIGVGHKPHDEANYIKTKKYPDLVVFGVEANVDTYKDRVGDYCGSLINKGIWSKKCKKKFYQVKDFGRSSFLEGDKNWMKEKKVHLDKVIEIDCITLDQFDKNNKTPDNILLWMDIEGSELEALKGADKLLKSKRVKYIFLEISIKKRRENEPSEEEVFSFLKKYGYELKLKYGGAQTFRNYLFGL